MLGGTLPRKRAPIALEIEFSSITTQSPRVDNACKWLLDELGGFVYRDDEQVKLLFASKDHLHRHPAEPSLPSLSNPRAGNPRIDVTARRLSDVRADLRRARDLEEPWDPMHRDANPLIEGELDEEIRRDTLQEPGARTRGIMQVAGATTRPGPQEAFVRAWRTIYSKNECDPSPEVGVSPINRRRTALHRDLG